MNTLSVRDNGARAMLARITAAQEPARVRVGVLDDAVKESEDGDSTMSLLEVAAVHEFGAGHVPQRSFIRAGVDEHERDLRAVQHALAVQVFKGDVTLTVALDRLGAKAAATLQNRISRGLSPPLAAATVEAKGSSKPLVDTGQLKSSITWLVLA